MYDDKDYGNRYNKVLWLGSAIVGVFVVVYIAIGFMFLFLVPDFWHSNSKGEAIERGWRIPFGLSFPVTFSLIRGFNKWKKGRNQDNSKLGK